MKKTKVKLEDIVKGDYIEVYDTRREYLYIKGILIRKSKERLNYADAFIIIFSLKDNKIKDNFIIKEDAIFRYEEKS